MNLVPGDKPSRDPCWIQYLETTQPVSVLNPVLGVNTTGIRAESSTWSQHNRYPCWTQYLETTQPVSVLISVPEDNPTGIRAESSTWRQQNRYPCWIQYLKTTPWALLFYTPEDQLRNDCLQRYSSYAKQSRKLNIK